MNVNNNIYNREDRRSTISPHERDSIHSASSRNSSNQKVKFTYENPK